MKRMLLTMIGALLLGVATASYPYGYGHANSVLVVKTTNNSLISMKLDYEWFAPSNRMRVTGLAPGNHRLKITRHQGHQHYGYQNCTAHRAVVYNRYINVPPATRVVVMVDHLNRIRVRNMPLNNATCSTGGGYGSSYGTGYGGYGNNYGNSYYTGGGNGNYGVNQFNQLKYTMQNASFDRDKLQIAQQYIAANGVAAQQVLELMNMLTFESYKLDLAKYAFQHTYDKENYYIVNNGFTFSSSIRELNNYIAYY